MESLKYQIENSLKKIISDNIPIAVSNRHAHLDQSTMDILFGKDYQLNKLRDLSQPGYYAAKEVVTIKGIKGKIENVRILGPLRNQTQVEISMTDAIKLGIEPILKESGKLDETPGITLLGPNGEINLNQGAIIAKRHIHMPTWYAKIKKFKNGDLVKVGIKGERGGILSEVIVRTGEELILEMHLDTDEANGLGVGKSAMGKIIR